MRNFWRYLRIPTLVRRIMIAQMLLLTLLWCIFLTYILWDNLRSPPMLSGNKTYETILTLVDRMGDRPHDLTDVLETFSKALREGYGGGEDPKMSISLIVRKNKEIIYSSDGAPVGVTNTGYGMIQSVQSNDRTWTSRTLKSRSSDTEVTLLTPAGGWNFFIYLNSRGYYILPLLVCIPFLLFPAWLSIRIAMRPWNKVANEVSLRTPEDLSPLKAVPKHKELRQIVDAINIFLARVRESTERERTFIADAAHELRTPLAAMRVNVEALQSDVSNVSQQELLAGIIRSNSRAARLVNQLLLLMHSEARINTVMEPVPLTTLIQERMAELAPLAAESRIELEFYSHDEVWITGVRERLMSLIDNLIENAVKYSPEGGRVEVEVRSLEKSIQLRISDAGPGIMVELRERVFDRFFRDPNQIQSGSGLGLAIVKAVAQQHNSSVLLSTSAEGGLMVIVDIPNQNSV
ncbi:two-component sensor histidine kinase [Citrobacter freundii]|nr:MULTISPECIES: ATP-binding protein [Enterobacterales]HEE0120588.1 two-component sensor histidine kinase [Citrobacter gillenii]ATY90386.1 two-component sensor histidine kinase [Pectobacterium atrosepticum]AYH00998.1 two-component sensor histidine kinase [Pectobacterium parmentieri]EKN3989295.1 two-component sensor histidine kinase [Yersinia enterocolitica]EKN4087143.1 two-component sensor histidine kinase [Yersinia enterocolitica]